MTRDSRRLRSAARAAQAQIPALLALLAAAGERLPEVLERCEAAGDDLPELLDELDDDDPEAVLARFLRLRLLAAAVAC
jgi:hypothetical protein